jgi:hypothetical protein
MLVLLSSSARAYCAHKVAFFRYARSSASVVWMKSKYAACWRELVLSQDARDCPGQRRRHVSSLKSILGLGHILSYGES